LNALTTEQEKMVNLTAQVEQSKDKNLQLQKKLQVPGKSNSKQERK